MKDKYPGNWKEIVEQVRERSGDTCEWCGVENGDVGAHTPQGWKYRVPNPIQIVLTVAHLDHDPSNPAR